MLEEGKEIFYDITREKEGRPEMTVCHINPDEFDITMAALRRLPEHVVRLEAPEVAVDLMNFGEFFEIFFGKNPPEGKVIAENPSRHELPSVIIP